MVQYDSEKYFQHSIKRSETTDKENGLGTTGLYKGMIDGSLCVQ
jgi:hypothetical protein